MTETLPESELVGAVDPARELALVLAVDFHKTADTDDPTTVVETAQAFAQFLLEDLARVGKHERTRQASVGV